MPADLPASGGEHEGETDQFLAALDALGLPRLGVSLSELKAATSDRHPFDVVGWEFIGRAGRACEMLVDATGGLADGSTRGLTIDEAVNGGLLVRTTKLVRALFDATQSEESEAHQILARCIAETAINLRWLLAFGDAETYRRYRADAYGSFLRVLENVDIGHADPIVKGTGVRVADILERELREAGVERADVPRRAGHWAGSLRDRFEAVAEAGLYDVFFGSHSDFVHGSWHELRTFHLRMTPRGYAVELKYGGITPSAMYETCRLIFAALRDYADRMPVAGFDREAFRLVAEGTMQAAISATLEFARFVAEGGIDADTERLLQTQLEAAEFAVRERVEYQAEQAGGEMQALRYGEDTPAWTDVLVRRFSDARRAGIRACPHLQENPDQPSIWMAPLPDFLACQGRECERQLVPMLEKRLGHRLEDEPARCSACGREALVQGVSVGIGTTMIRGMICEECKSRVSGE